MNYIRCLLLFLPILLLLGCETTTLLQEINKSPFEIIEHAAIHMQDGTGLSVISDTVMPGPHLEPDSIAHRRIDVTLQVVDDRYAGYIHFGPDVTGDILVCADVSIQMRVTNRTAQGDIPLAIERKFTEQEIADSVKTTFVKSAILFEACTGGNIIEFEPVDRQIIHVVIEEVEHEHDE